MFLIKKIFSILICMVLVFLIFSVSTNAVSLGISASAAVVMVAQTGEVLYEKEAHTKRSMASTTKIMTSLIALETADLKREITVKSNELNVEGTSMGLLPDDKVTFETLVYGMLLQSGNDAANVTAMKLGGSREKFISLMNKRANELGMKNTNFVTPSGLDAKEHYSTAYDMALLGSAAILNPDFRYICSQKQAVVYYGNPPYRRTLSNHNKLLSYYDGCIGLKTGFTKKSGRCLVSAAEKDGVVIVAVTLNAPDDWNDHKKLLDYGFSQVKNQIVEVGDVPTKIQVIGGKKSYAKVKVSEQFSVNLSEKTDKISSQVLLDKFLYAPVKEGDKAGKIFYYLGDKKIGESIILADESITALKIEKKKSLFQRIIDFIKNIFK